jgi:hypothetical protein
MKLSLGVVVPSAVAVLATVLLCGPAASQTATVPSLPDVTVDAPKQVAKPHRPKQVANTATSRRISSTAQTSSSTTHTPSVAPDSVQARIAQLEKASSSCNGGCETSFKSGNAPWVGCSLSSQEFAHFDSTCSDTLTYKHYQDCRETKAFLGWDRNKIWLHCSSLLAGGKFQVAELKRARHPR